MHIERYNDTDIVFKRHDPESLKTIMYVQPKALIAERVCVEDVIEAAHEISRQLVDLKYNKLQGLGTSKIDTAISVNYYGTLFTVTENMSALQAKQAYEYSVRQANISKMGLKLVNLSP
jgi:hypothetical protein